MIEQVLEKEMTKLEKQLVKLKDADFVVELRSLDAAQLEERLKRQAIFKQETISAQKKDEELSELSDRVRNLKAPYLESIRLNDKISRFISLLMEEKR